MFHQDFYFHLVSNYINFLILELFVHYCSHTDNTKKKYTLRITYIVILFIFSIPENSPLDILGEYVAVEANNLLTTLFGKTISVYLSKFIGIIISSLLGFGLDLIYIIIAIKNSIRYKLLLLLKYELFIVTTALTAGIFFLTLSKLTNTSSNSYTSLLALSITYVLMSLYVNIKNISLLGIQTSYKGQLNVLILFSILALTGLYLLMDTKLSDQLNVMPIVFALIVIIIVVSLSVYQSIVDTLKKEVSQNMLLENVKLEKEYYQKINDSLQALNKLKHDFKNHLNVINYYSANNETSNLIDYVNKISDTIYSETLVNSPHVIVSSILSVKKQDCIEKGILFKHNLDFNDITINDFDLTTILGNILDNAITAASKCDKPYVLITLQQIDSYLEISCENNYTEALQIKKGHFISTKKGPSIFHGIGLKNVENTVKNRNGTVEISYNTSTYSITILLPNY